MNASPSRPTFGVVIPFFNEAAYLPATLDSWAAQERAPEQYVLVDNASTDESREIAEAFCQQQGKDKVTVVTETNAGKVHAMQRGCPLVKQQWVVTCDADTYYPPHYLQKAEELALRNSTTPVVALMALGVEKEKSEKRDAFIQDRLQLAQKLPGKCFTGGFGQIFRADILAQVGGYDAKIWPYVLMDHEIVHRLYAHGTGLYDSDFWCSPSERRTDRSAVRWNLPERMLYRNVPRALEGWYFYKYLAGRFEKRGLHHINLRNQDWNEQGR